MVELLSQKTKCDLDYEQSTKINIQTLEFGYLSRKNTVSQLFRAIVTWFCTSEWAHTLGSRAQYINPIFTDCLFFH